LKTETDRIAEKGSEIPQAVVDGGERSAMLGVDNLSQQHGGGQLAERVAKPKDESTDAEHSEVLCSGVDDTADNHEAAAKDDAGLATKSIDNCWHCEHGDNGTNGEHIGQETEEIGLVLVRPNMMEIDLPGIILLQEVEEGSKLKQC
jgi:hypothetical protein